MGQSLRNCPGAWLWVYSLPYHLALQVPIPEARQCLSLGLQGPSPALATSGAVSPPWRELGEGGHWLW